MSDTFPVEHTAAARWGAQADRPIQDTNDLAVFLGGSGDTFTGHLLVLMCKADPVDAAKLGAAFPQEWAMLRIWQNIEPAPTFAQMEMIREILRS